MNRQIITTTTGRLRQADRQDFARLLGRVSALFVAWRIGLWLIGALGAWYSRAVHPYAKLLSPDGYIIEREQGVKEFVWRIFAANWIQWDSHHYQDIALNGYRFYNQRWPTITFFPLYPLLARLFLPLAGRRIEIAALLVSHLAFFAALLLLYDLLARDFDHVVAYRTLVFLLVFPTSVFFGAGYSEALALLLVIGAVWAMRRQRWWLAGAAGFLLTLTRLPGVFVALILAVTYLQHHQWRAAAIRSDFLAVLLPPLALAIFMFFQWCHFDTPFAFLIAQRQWDNSLSPPWVMPSRLLEALRTWPEWPITAFELTVWISFIGLTLLALLRLPLPYGLTTLLFVLPPYLSSWYRSLPRHVLLAFPAFVVMAILAEQPWIRRLLIGTLAILLAIATVLFVNGYWVA
ncbi:MAG: glycosyltransferase family 39 protein [Chloroflexota bacterium]|nr:glycosyltransferase family 39 protein [Chloroflexota bacterium]